jgi:hypothetical protein
MHQCINCNGYWHSLRFQRFHLCCWQLGRVSCHCYSAVHCCVAAAAQASKRGQLGVVFDEDISTPEGPNAAE